jgi:hypothetical protein
VSLVQGKKSVGTSFMEILCKTKKNKKLLKIFLCKSKNEKFLRFLNEKTVFSSMKNLSEIRSTPFNIIIISDSHLRVKIL